MGADPTAAVHARALGFAAHGVLLESSVKGLGRGFFVGQFGALTLKSLESRARAGSRLTGCALGRSKKVCCFRSNAPMKNGLTALKIGSVIAFSPWRIV